MSSVVQCGWRGKPATGPAPFVERTTNQVLCTVYACVPHLVTLLLPLQYIDLPRRSDVTQPSFISVCRSFDGQRNLQHSSSLALLPLPVNRPWLSTSKLYQSASIVSRKSELRFACDINRDIFTRVSACPRLESAAKYRVHFDGGPSPPTACLLSVFDLSGRAACFG